MIILLNGVPGSGKTSVGALLRDTLPGAWMFADIDRFFEMLSPRHMGTGPLAEEGFAVSRGDSGLRISIGPVGEKFLSGFARAVLAFSDAGVNVVCAHFLLSKEILDACAAMWRGQRVLFVALHCPWEIAEERVTRREGIAWGLARETFAALHADARYDIELDTSALTPEESAARIQDCL